MKKQKHLHPHCFLNRIALVYDCRPRKAVPLRILKHFFDYATPAEHLKAFDDFCLAALHHQYRWRKGSPGNALYYREQIELLIEAMYLFYHRKKKVCTAF